MASQWHLNSVWGNISGVRQVRRYEYELPDIHMVHCLRNAHVAYQYGRGCYGTIYLLFISDYWICPGALVEYMLLARRHIWPLTRLSTFVYNYMYVVCMLGYMFNKLS